MWSPPPPDPVFDCTRAFERLGDALTGHSPDSAEGYVVRKASDPTEVMAQVRSARAAGATPLVLMTIPPAWPLPELGAPVVPVIAWPYDRIPDDFDISALTYVIALDPHSRRVLQSTLPSARIVEYIDPGVPDAVLPRLKGGLRLTVPGTVIDTRELEISETGIRHLRPEYRFAAQPWDGRPFGLRFSVDRSERGLLVGFYGSEVWGTWSRIRDPWVVLPRTVSGDVRLSMDAHGFAANAGRRIGVSLGGAGSTIVLPEKHAHVETVLRGVRPSNVLRFHDLDVSNSGTSTDIRTLGIALGSVRLGRPGVVSKVLDRARRLIPTRRTHARETDVEVDGKIFITQFDPTDALTDWGRLITAFCQCFRERTDVTLLVRMPDAGLEDYFGELQLVLHRIGPFQCRVVVIDGGMPKAMEQALWGRADVGVGASGGSASCLRLIDFAASGRPVVAPDNASYSALPGDRRFDVAWTSGPTEWSLGADRPFTVCAARLDPDSLIRQLELAVAADSNDGARRRSGIDRATFVDLLADATGGAADANA